jgi:hypothetical protein
MATHHPMSWPKRMQSLAIDVEPQQFLAVRIPKRTLTQNTFGPEHADWCLALPAATSAVGRAALRAGIGRKRFDAGGLPPGKSSPRRQKRVQDRFGTHDEISQGAGHSWPRIARRV